MGFLRKYLIYCIIVRRRWSGVDGFSILGETREDWKAAHQSWWWLLWLIRGDWKRKRDERWRGEWRKVKRVLKKSDRCLIRLLWDLLFQPFLFLLYFNTTKVCLAVCNRDQCVPVNLRLLWKLSKYVWQPKAGVYLIRSGVFSYHLHICLVKENDWKT